MTTVSLAIICHWLKVRARQIEALNLETNNRLEKIEEKQ